VLAAAVIAAVRAASGHWMATGGAGSLPDLIRQAVRQVACPPQSAKDPARNAPAITEPR